MKKTIATLILIFVAAAIAAAHPLGNFSVNQFSRIEVVSGRVNVKQVLDLAEIPTATEKRAIDTDGDGKYSSEELAIYANAITPAYLQGLVLNVAGRSVALNSKSVEAVTVDGAGGLQTLRITWDLAADLPADVTTGTINFENRNNSDRIGWNEIVLAAGSGMSIYDTASFGSSMSDELRSYPADGLNDTPGERTAAFSFAIGTPPADAKPLLDRTGVAVIPKATDSFAALINVPAITPMVVVFGLLVAFGLGALHAMSPGHGKTVVGAYLVGSRGTAMHAVFLGLTVTITHTIGVFALGLITLFASEYILPEKLLPTLGFISGLLVLYIGGRMLKDRLLGLLGYSNTGHHHHHGGDGHTHSHGEHSHDRDHNHDHGHAGQTHSHGGKAHTHMPPEDLSWRNLAALGISGGLLPCPSALVLMLAAVSLNRVGYGIVLTLMFSLGLATTLSAVGFAFIYLGRVFSNTGIAKSRLVKVLPVFSAAFITCLGAVICWQAIPR